MENQSANKFEKYPGVGSEASSENLEKARDWENAMSGKSGNKVPGFKEDKYGIAKEENNYYGETVNDETENKFDNDLAEASNILNFGLDSVARTYGVEATINKIKKFDVSGKEDPIRDLFLEFGVDTKAERDDLNDESMANEEKVAEARREVNSPSRSTSVEAAVKAIQEMKELISEIEGADPKYETLREGAKSAGMGYFEYAIKDYNTRGLTELFQVLKAQREKDNLPSGEERNDGADEENVKVGDNEKVEDIEKTGEDSFRLNDAPDNNVSLNPEILK